MGLVTATGIQFEVRANDAASADLEKVGKSLEHLREIGRLNSNQWGELAAAARHAFDAILEGQSPLRALTVEGVKASSVFSSGSGGVMGVLRGVTGALGPMGWAFVAATAAVGGSIFMGDRWAKEYMALVDVAKTTTVAIADLYEMQQVKGAGGKGGFDVGKGMFELAAKMREATIAGGDFAKLMEKNNIALTSSAGKARDVKSIFDDISKLVSKANNEIDKIKFAEKIGLGREAVPMMENYVKSLDKATDVTRRLTTETLTHKREAALMMFTITKAWDDFTESLGRVPVGFGKVFNVVNHYAGISVGTITGLFVGGFYAVSQTWSELPRMFGRYATYAVNAVVGTLSSGLNAAIEAWNATFWASPEKQMKKLTPYFSDPNAWGDASNSGKRIATAFADGFNTESARVINNAKNLNIDFSKMESIIPSGGTQILGLYDKSEKAARHHVDKLAQEAERLYKETRTPFEAYQDQLKKIDALNNAGKFDKYDGLYDRAKRMAGENYLKALDGLNQLDAGLDKTKDYFKSVDDAAQSFINNFVDGNLDAMKSAGDLLKALDKIALSQLFKGFTTSMQDQHPLYGGGSGLGDLLGGFFKKFAGMFANGGQIGSGQWGIVGEGGGMQHAEAVLGPATVVPMRNMGGGGGVTNITINAQGADPGQIALLRQQMADMQGNFGKMVRQAVTSERRANLSFVG